MNDLKLDEEIMKTHPSEFGRRLLRLRMERGLTQLKAAEGLGVINSTVRLMERGKRNPSISLFKRYCEFYEVSPNYLLGYTQFRNEEEQLEYILNKLKDNGIDINSINLNTLQEAAREVITEE